jgi:hypothetical protein
VRRAEGGGLQVVTGGTSGQRGEDGQGWRCRKEKTYVYGILVSRKCGRRTTLKLWLASPKNQKKKKKTPMISSKNRKHIRKTITPKKSLEVRPGEDQKKLGPYL